tara:strand:- start:5149 stop:6408 length:1260 start_codon:yes stop_codon:yes gene_type:complete
MRIYDLIFTIFISFFLVFFLGANFNPDSISYINDYKIRPPAYPLIINFFDYVFEKNSLSILAYFQVFCWLCASIYFSVFLCKILNLEFYNRYIFIFFLILPINPIHQYGNTILTESFSYICCIGIFINIYNFYKYQNKKYFFYLFFILLLALTLRHQMIFLNFSFLIFSLILLILKETRKSFILFIVSFFSLVSATFLNKSSNFLKHHQFEENKRIGLQLIILPLFNISQESILKINNLEERKIIAEMKEKYNAINPFSEVNKANNISPPSNINHFASSYNLIISDSVLPVVEKYYPNLSENQRDEKLIYLSKTILETSLKNEPLKTIKIYLDNIIKLGFSGFIWFFICCFIFYFSLTKFLKSKSSTIFFILFLSTTHFINIFIVSLVEPVLFRYSFYTNLALCALFFGFCIKAVKTIK